MIWWVLRGFDQPLKVAELGSPQRFVFRQPPFPKQAEWAGIERIEMVATGPSDVHQIGGSKHGQMLRDGWAADGRKMGGNFARRQFSRHQQIQYLTTDGIGYGLKNLVHAHPQVRKA